jgi:hypothetical protein
LFFIDHLLFGDDETATARFLFCLFPTRIEQRHCRESASQVFTEVLFRAFARRVIGPRLAPDKKHGVKKNIVIVLISYYVAPVTRRGIPQSELKVAIKYAVKIPELVASDIFSEAYGSARLLMLLASYWCAYSLHVSI